MMMIMIAIITTMMVTHRANHSCRPNCEFHWCQERGLQVGGSRLNRCSRCRGPGLTGAGAGAGRRVQVLRGAAGALVCVVTTVVSRGQ